MILVFVSNFFNHHQSSISDCFSKLPDVDFRFIETARVPEERLKLGYHARFERDYILRVYENSEVLREAMDWIDRADAVIFGSAPESMIRDRIRKGRLVYRYSERPLKNGSEWAKYPIRLLNWNYRNHPRRNVWLLSASAFAPHDYRRFGMYRGRAFRWGYFPAFEQVDSIDRLLSEKDSKLILWVGRFIDWKRPDLALETAKRLRDRGSSFRLLMIGSGEMREQLENTIQRWSLEEHVQICSAVPPETVRQKMREAGIVWMTSTKREGWGAVLNEAMNSGCAVLAADQIGAVPYLIRPGHNGCVFPSEDPVPLADQTAALLASPEEQRRIGAEAYQTIASLWTPEIAAQRLAALTRALLQQKQQPRLYPDGPCSPAPILDQSWLHTD